jgi:hypothetical protein
MFEKLNTNSVLATLILIIGLAYASSAGANTLRNNIRKFERNPDIVKTLTARVVRAK